MLIALTVDKSIEYRHGLVLVPLALSFVFVSTRTLVLAFHKDTGNIYSVVRWAPF